MRCFMVDTRSEAWDKVGAMYWRWHELEEYDIVEPHALPHLAVFTPAGLFCMDCPDTDEPHLHWTVVGVPPNVTVTPSINVNNEEWHGYITNGVMLP